jgi:hypothetical protein
VSNLSLEPNSSFLHFALNLSEKKKKKKKNNNNNNKIF